MFILTHYPFSEDIREQTLCNRLKAVNNNLGQKRTPQIRKAALASIGIKEGDNGAREQLLQLVEDIELIQEQ
ncbi:MAG: hypothetical protein ACOX0F_04020 [Syntrophomonadaceae bacterium]|jgi:hypothetical protein